MARRSRAKAAPQPEVTISENTSQPVTHENEAEPVEPEPVAQEPDIFDQQIALRQQEKAQAIVADVADSTRMPEQTGFAAQHIPPTTASGGPGTVRAGSHAEAVGKRGPRYNEQGITDKLAGARMLEHHDPFFSIIRFDEKPSDAVREMLREAEFRWHAENKEWNRPIRFETRQQDRIDAERVFEEVCGKIRAEKGITHNFGGA